MSSASGESGESDIEIKTNLPKKKVTKKAPRSPTAGILKKEPKKMTTKEMVQQAIIELTANTRKGTSMYAIKKFVTENNNIDPVKINYLIKKSIKSGLEKGTIKQMKGIGVTGSFRMATKKPEKKKTVKINSEKDPEKTDKVKTKVKKSKENPEKPSKVSKKNVLPPKEKTKKAKSTKTTEKKEVKSSKSTKTEKVAKPEKVSKKKELQTPSKKKKTLLRRKSIGSIIKPPKMKPKAK